MDVKRLPRKRSASDMDRVYGTILDKAPHQATLGKIPKDIWSTHVSPYLTIQDVSAMRLASGSLGDVVPNRNMKNLMDIMHHGVKRQIWRTCFYSLASAERLGLDSKQLLLYGLNVAVMLEKTRILATLLIFIHSDHLLARSFQMRDLWCPLSEASYLGTVMS